MRKLGIVLGIAVAAIVILVVLAATMLDVNRFRPLIQAELQAKLGRPVTLGELHLHLFPLSIKADGLSIAEAPAFGSSRPFATAQDIYVSAGLLSLIHGSPQIKTITLSQPHIELIRNASGVWNFSTLGGASAQPRTVQQSALAPSATANSSEGGGITLKQLKITAGRVAVTDLKTRSPRTVYNNIDVTLSNFAPNQPVDLEAAIHFPGRGKERVSFKGNAGPLGSSAIIPVDGQISIDGVALAGLSSIMADSIPPNTDAMATGHATVTSQRGIIGAKGTLKLPMPLFKERKSMRPSIYNTILKSIGPPI